MVAIRAGASHPSPSLATAAWPDPNLVSSSSCNLKVQKRSNQKVLADLPGKQLVSVGCAEGHQPDERSGLRLRLHIDASKVISARDMDPANDHQFDPLLSRSQRMTQSMPTSKMQGD